MGVDGQQEIAMGKIADAETASSDHRIAPFVLLIDVNGLSHALDAVIAETAGRSGGEARRIAREVRFAVGKFLKVGAKVTPAIAADPQAVPPYLGLRKDGNPITFFILYFRLRVEAGTYYQSDLQRDNPMLFNAIRNLLRNKEAPHLLEEAEHELDRVGISPTILGKRVRDVADIGDLLPARRAIEPRMKDRALVEAQRPVLAPRSGAPMAAAE